MHKSGTSKQIVTRSQTRKKTLGAQPTTNTCTCPHPNITTAQTQAEIMNDEQKEVFQTMFTEMCTELKENIAKESHTQRTKLDKLDTRLDKQPSSSGLKLDAFDGNPAVDAITWLDSFSRIANINNWSAENQLNAFPLYLSGVAHAWFLSLKDDVQKDLGHIKAAFQERFAAGPQDWILSQQLTSRKQAKGERIDAYIADITRLCKRLKLSDADSMRYFTQGLQPHIQSYVTLARPKDFQEAESLARMKELVDNNQATTDTQTLLTQMENMFTKLMNQSTLGTSKPIAAVSTEPPPTQLDKRLDELSKQMKQLQKQNQQRIAAYDQPQTGAQRFPQMRNWQGQPNRQIDQLQRQVSRLENELRRYQNPRRPDFRSYGRNFRTVEGDPICNFCQRVGHTWRTCQQRGRDPRLPPSQGNGFNRSQFSGPPNARQTNPNLNG